MKVNVLFVLALFLLNAFSCQTEHNDWESLFNGKDLNQWEKKGGKATYHIEDGAIVGRAVADSPNTFLCTKSNYGDFILEFEVLLENELNSGVQFRSHVNDKGYVYGYQCEIDPSPRRFTGGIYDEGRRAWMYPLSRNEKAQDAFKMHEWNQFRIECLGNELRTYVNGQLCAWMIDAETASGFIGLQVHGIGSQKKVGYEVKWRNIKIRTTEISEHRRPIDQDVTPISYLTNQLTEFEKEKGYQLLFDGKSNEKWMSLTGDPFPQEGWVLENGALIHRNQQGGGDIVTKEKYENFELELEFNIAKAGNSGIKYFVDASEEKGDEYLGCEFQILDDRNHPDGKLGVDGNRTVASLYDIIPAGNLSVKDRGKQFKGVNKWNHARIIVNKGKVEHWLNHEKALEYDRYSQRYDDLVKVSKFADKKDYGKAKSGRILLQDHSDEVKFRSIKIRRL